MANRPACKYGSSCYRKNPQHLREYFHPSLDVSQQQGDTDQTGVREKELHKKHSILVPEEKSPAPDVVAARKRVRPIVESEALSVSKRTMTEKGSDEEVDTVRANIKRKFLIQMPDDFYQFWEFCNVMKPNDPLNSLSSILGLKLVGPYHELAGLLTSSTQCVLHYRYYYDPPELVTVLAQEEKGEKVKGYHIGYYKDDPSGASGVFMVSNSSSEGCQLKHTGLNIFAAVRKEVSVALKTPSLSNDFKKELKELESSLLKKGNELGLNMKDMKPSNRTIVSVCFNGIGMSVPVDPQLDVGYRPLTMTNKELRKLLDALVSCKDDTKREKLQESLQEVITFVQFANDECDYGMGLELGTDLFCHGSQLFHDQILQVLPLAYDLLGRKDYAVIIEEHLHNRQKEPIDLTID